MARRVHHAQTKLAAVVGIVGLAVLLTLGVTGGFGGHGAAAPPAHRATLPARYLPFLAGQENRRIPRGAAAGLVALPDPWAVPPTDLRFLGGGS